MTKRTNVDDLPEFDAAQFLNSEEAIAAYLAGVAETNDPTLIASALGDVARLRGATGLDSAYKA